MIQFITRFRNILICFIFTLVSLCMPLVNFIAHADTAAWLSGWSNRSSITINNTGPAALTNYQVKITLPSTGLDYTKVQPSGADIRITSSDGVTPLRYWIEQFSSTSRSGIIWAQMPTMASSSTSTIYLYYGNPTATSQSNGAAIFPMFSDFNNSAWQKLSNMPITTADETVAQVNGIFYILGGYNNGASNPLNSNYAFNPATNTYSQKANMPTLRWGPISATVNNKIYVLGGQNNSGGSSANEMYDPTTNTWTTKAPLPYGMGNQGITGCTDGTNIYLSYNGKLYTYNPVTNTYAQKSSLPHAVLSWATCSYANGKIYIVNGYENGAKNYTQIYNIATNSWAQGAPSPFATYGSLRESPVVGNSLYIIQGQRANAEFTSAAYMYDIAHNTWTEKSFGPHAADGVAGGVYNGKIYTFGGRQDWSAPYGLPFASVYNPAGDTDQNWSQVTGNFEADQTGLHRMTPLRGTISNGPSLSQIQSTYQSDSSYVIEAQTNQPASGSWSSLAFNANDGSYNHDLTGYQAPYNDQGLSPQETSFYREIGSQFTKLAKSSMAYGAQRFVIVNTPSTIKIYRNSNLISQSNDTTYRGGHIDILASIGNKTTVNFLFVRQYTAIEPTVTVETTPVSCPCSLWPNNIGPAASSTANTSAYELGTRFYSEVPGTITGLRFYKEPGMAVSHTGHLWDNQGHLLATVTFSGESTSGWQLAMLATPVAIAANTPYVVSYHITSGPFAYTQSQFASQTLGQAPLHTYQDGAAGPNGIFTEGNTLAYPQGTWSATNYWADVVFNHS